MDSLSFSNEFTKSMKTVLKTCGMSDQEDAFWQSYEKPRAHALRMNPGKSSVHTGIETLKTEYTQQIVPHWTDAYYLKTDVSGLGNLPAHRSGIYYMQEPSAMFPVSLLNGKLPSGAICLDLCAAPGGKSTQLASLIGPDGWLLVNEPHRDRADILSENIERWGHPRVVVTRMEPAGLASRFPAFFDAIVVDAPCSGEGMFRKDPDALKEWSLDNVRKCTLRQQDILTSALQMLKPDGYLVYSTCTFNLSENEEIVQWLVTKDDALALLESKRCWPHLEPGEGHFAALLKRNGSEETQPDETFTGKSDKSAKSRKPVKDPAIQAMADWRKEATQWWGDAWRSFEEQLGTFQPLLFGEHLYLFPLAGGMSAVESSMLDGLKMVRAGLHVASMKGKQWIPGHALALSIPMVNNPFFPKWHLSEDDARTSAYFRGETIPVSSGETVPKGWVVLTIDHIPCGWVKVSDGHGKNHYPKGLRTLK